MTDEHKKQRHAVLNCIFGAKLMETNLPDTKGTIYYRSKLEKEIVSINKLFEEKIIRRVDGSRLELFHTMNSLATLISRITNKDFNSLNIIYRLLEAYDNGELQMIEDEGDSNK